MAWESMSQKYKTTQTIHRIGNEEDIKLNGNNGENTGVSGNNNTGNYN